MKNKRDYLKDIEKNDPEWVKNIATYAFKFKKEKKKEEYSRLLKELYMDYLRRGMKPKIALKKAKFVVESFNGLNKK